MKKNIKILLVDPGRSPRVITVLNTREAFEEVLGGSLEFWGLLPSRVFLIQRENARALGMPFNAYDPCRKGEDIYGSFLLCGFEENDFTSLTLIQKLELFLYFSIANRCLKTDRSEGNGGDTYE